jgi:septation ring formation regulator EzrA
MDSDISIKKIKYFDAQNELNEKKKDLIQIAKKIKQCEIRLDNLRKEKLSDSKKLKNSMKPKDSTEQETKGSRYQGDSGKAKEESR